MGAASERPGTMPGKERQETFVDEAPGAKSTNIVMARSADCVGCSLSADAIVSKNA